MAGDIDGYLKMIGTAEIGYKDDRGSSLLQIAIAYRREEIALDLIERGVSLNNISVDGMNELQSAIYQGLFLVAERLLERGIDVKNVDKHGNEALWYASTHPEPSLDLIKKILEMGGDPHALNKCGRSPLDAIARSDSELAALLESYS